MSKLRTVSQLQDRLDKEFSWRLKEVADLKVTVKANTSLAQPTVIRAGVALLYAHWEGFIKRSSQDYLSFVSDQRLNYGELANCFVVFGAKKHLANIVGARQSAVNVSAVEFFRTCAGERAELSTKNAVDTRSNLSSTVFENIALSLGVSTTPYDSYYNLIDESLLARRNKIAHGEFLDLGADAFKEIADDIVMLLRMYKTDLENLASLDAYKI